MSYKRSGSGTAAAASSTPPPSHYNDRGERERWPVLVYRLQSHRGWEVYSDPDAEATAAASEGGKKANTKSKSRGGGEDGGDAGVGRGIDASSKAPREAAEELTAAPRAGCIEVRRMRLRIQLFQQHRPWNPNQQPPPPSQRGHGRDRAGRGKENRPDNAARAEGSDEKRAGDHDEDGDDGSDDPDEPGADGWNNNSLLVRRRDTLLVTTRRGMGAVVFRFKSSRDCIDFCDRLVHLNWDYLMPPSPEGDGPDAQDTASCGARAGGGDGRVVVNSMDGRDIHVDRMNGIKRHRGAAFGDADDVSERRLRATGGRRGGVWMEEEPPPIHEKMRPCRRREEMMSYIVKLAHSEDFRGFVDELERGLEMTTGAAVAFGD